MSLNTRKIIRFIIKSGSGFSILEVVIAIFIITMGLVGVLSLVAQNLQVKYVNKNGIIASMLAQEGIELVRNRRDENWHEGLDHKTGIIGDGTYAIDAENIVNVDGEIDNANARLKFNSGGYYCHGSWAAIGACDQGNSSFYRLITVTDNGVYIDVQSKVRFKKGTNNYDYTAETRLYDWFE
jgi:Tfp pilus assembly protein PilV